MLEAFRQAVAEASVLMPAPGKSIAALPDTDARASQPSPPGLQMRFLGGLQISLDGSSISDDLPAKALALVCYLAVTGQAHSRSSLGFVIWP
jgi:hypothetical protein